MNRLDIEFGVVALLLLVISVGGTFAVSAALRRRRYYCAAVVSIIAVLFVLGGRFMFVYFADSLARQTLLPSPPISSSPAALP